MTTPKLTPAQLAHLAIYNPSLGPTDDTFPDQLVFYHSHSRSTHQTRRPSKKTTRKDAAGDKDGEDGKGKDEDKGREDENEKLRQIGLAQGMVEFARSFSPGETVDSVETEGRRIVLGEVEGGWWVLAAVDLTRIPTITSERKDGGGAKVGVEYSSREVSSPALLLQQVKQAHRTFSLHHGPSLSELYTRLGREKFCRTLDRFWTRFARGWDVLLHGNPAVEVLGGVKMAAGGELGYGVGEEEWGSGERAVLEDLARETEGLVDVVMARFGDVPTSGEGRSGMEEEGLPWLGSGREPGVEDGVVFGGVGALERRSLADVSAWMRQIYTYGDHAYGVRDNPLRERRKRRRRNPPEVVEVSNGAIDQASTQEISTNRTTPVGETRRLSVEDTRPGIPPPIVSAAEESLKKATNQAEHETIESEDVDGGSTTLGIPDQYMKYLTFGLSTFGKQSTTKRRPTTSSQASGVGQQPTNGSGGGPSKGRNNGVLSGEDEDDPTLKHLDPVPDGDTLKSKIATQKLFENKGYFQIGLKGDLDELLEEEEEEEEEQAILSDNEGAAGSRIVLRTLQVELTPKNDPNSDLDEPQASRNPSNSSTTTNFRRLRVLVYVRRPFIYTLLFEKNTSSLQYAKFYHRLHLNLAPIHGPLCTSTDPVKAAARIAAPDAESPRTGPKGRGTPNPLYHLLYDPQGLGLYTSIPNIPDPGTPAAEGILTALTGGGVGGGEGSLWTRGEAVNVHSQILNTLALVRGRREEVERSSKTSRGWWVVWLRLPASLPEQGEGKRVVGNPEVEGLRMGVLVRKAVDTSPRGRQVSGGSRAVSSMLSNMSFGLAGREEEVVGVEGTAGAQGLVGGIGVEGRGYLEGLGRVLK